MALERGTVEFADHWYAERNGKTLIEYGVGIGHIPVRMGVMRDTQGATFQVVRGGVEPQRTVRSGPGKSKSTMVRAIP